MARITVINDDRDFLALMAEVLDDMGHTVSTFHGLDRLDELAETQPDLVLVDLRLEAAPGALTGSQIIGLMREDPRLSSVPITLSTGDLRYAEDVQREYEAVRQLRVLIKPFSLDALEAAVATALSEGPRGDG